MKDGIFLGNRYQVLSKVGAGGMADVYKGKDTMLNRYVAVKVLKKEYREDENFVRKFRSEAQAAAGLLNPNIVNVYDVGEDRGLYYMVMELVEGITLKEYIARKGKLSHKEVISIAIQMCTGIGAAHAANIIHRDIKPQNIIISRDGKVKVTDFGIAKATTSNTISSNAMGSVHYSSPEQARGGFSDAKSDIYSIGITLFEMATGQVPFDGDSTVSVAIKHLQEEITPPSELVPDIPYSLEQIILKCTQKNGERRYSNTNALIQDLKRSLVDPEGDFVVIPPLRSADTVIITDDELDVIQSSSEDEYGDGEYDDGQYDDDGYGEGYDEYDDDHYDEYDDNQYDDSYEDEYGRDDEYDSYDSRGGKKRRRGDENVNPRMNKVMRILMIVVIIIIVFILLFTIGKAAGIFKSFDKGTEAEETEETVKVPDLLGKTEDEARKILKEKNLGFKVATYEESDRYEEGLICEQKIKAGEKVKKHTKIEVVVSSKLVGEEIIVPEVAGMDESEAQKKLEGEGIKVGTSEFVYSDQYAEGQVIGTTPSAGSKVTKDTEVIMQVSKGEDKKTIPDVLGKKDADAQAEIKSAGLKIGKVTYDYDNDVEEGRVVSQSPSSGKKVSAGTTVNLLISRGKKPDEKIQVQNFAGKDESELRAWAEANGLIAQMERTEPSNDYEKDTIISQNPSSGSLAKGGTIKYVLSSGMDPANLPSEDEQE